MQQGWLIYNHTFRDNQKFMSYMKWFQEVAHTCSLVLTLRRNDEVFFLLSDTQHYIDTKSSLPSFIVFFDKDIRLAQLLEHAGVRVFNTSRAIEVCDDKSLAGSILSLSGVPMPRTIFSPKTFRKYTKHDLEFLKTVVSELSFPVVIKEVFGSFGNEVYLAETQEELEDKVIEVSPASMLFQEYVEESKGRHLRMYVVGGKYCGAAVIINKEDWRSNVKGGELLPYHPSKEEILLAEKTCSALGLDFGGVDILFGKNGALVCEVNSNSFVKAFFEVTGINVAHTFCSYIADSLGVDSKEG